MGNLIGEANRDTDMENKHMDTIGERRVGGGRDWEVGSDVDTLLTLCIK